MPNSDPLALRHGVLVAYIWTLIGHARVTAQCAPTHQQAASHLRQLRHQRRRVIAAHRAEMQRQDFCTATVDGWFAPVETTLAKAEAHFQGVIMAARLRNAQDLTPQTVA